MARRPTKREDTVWRPRNRPKDSGVYRTPAPEPPPKPIPGGPPQYADAGDPGSYDPAEHYVPLDDDRIAEAGLIPAGFKLRARSMDERQEFTEHTKRVLAILDERDDVPTPYEIQSWVDWELYIAKRTMQREAQWAWGMTGNAGRLFRLIIFEYGRRMKMAADNQSIYED
jgi:hypothetical protein